MTATQPIASVRSVEKVFGSGPAAVRALRGIDLDVERGEVLLLIGPSGSGKTTLLSIMGCILRATTGGVRICGQDVGSLSRRDLAPLRLRHIGFVFQDFNLLPTLSAVENAEMPLHLAGVDESKARHRALEALAALDLNGRINAYPADLSGGEKQRVAIARALINHPSLVLADEPTAALDFENGSVILELLRQAARKRECGVVIVSHDNRARNFVDRVVCLEDGRLAPDRYSTTK